MAAQRVMHGRRRALLGCLALLAFLPAPVLADALLLRGLHFVSSEGDHNTLVLRARAAHFDPAHARATLEGIHARLGSKAPGAGAAAARGGLELRSERGAFFVETRDFEAVGAVRGATHDGRRFETEHLRYDAARGRISGDARIVLYERAGVFEGAGFEYLIAEDRFRLRGARLRRQAP